MNTGRAGKRNVIMLGVFWGCSSQLRGELRLDGSDLRVDGSTELPQ